MLFIEYRFRKCVKSRKYGKLLSNGAVASGNFPFTHIPNILNPDKRVYQRDAVQKCTWSVEYIVYGMVCTVI